MGRVSITKEFDWDMAHMLAGHEGLCRNLHGHTYRMQVEAMRIGGGLAGGGFESDSGMVIDFKDLKDIVKKTVIEPLDHGFMYWKHSKDPLEKEMAELLKRHGRKVAEVAYRPTAEAMALDFLERINEACKPMDVIVKRIKVWETASSYAEAVRED